MSLTLAGGPKFIHEIANAVDILNRCLFAKISEVRDFLHEILGGG